MRFLTTVVAIAAWCAQALVVAHANPAGFAYKRTTNTTLYGQPNGLVVAGRCNVRHPDFQEARRGGAEVLVYINPAERPNKPVCAQDERFYMGDHMRVPLWPYPSAGQRVNWRGTRLADMRAGSRWNLHVVRHVETLIREKQVDGVFIDVVGARLWSSLADWNSWPQWERDEWTDGNIDLVKRLDALRRSLDPTFIIVNNNVWDRGDSRGFAGERYVDGVAIEHPKLGVPDWHRRYVSRTFGDLGQRRVIVIARNTDEAKAWLRVPGVTHVSDQMQYAHPSPPPVEFRGPPTDEHSHIRRISRRR